MSLDEVTKELGRRYKAAKKAEKDQAEQRGKFFSEVTKELSNRTPARLTKEVEAKSLKEALEVAQKQNPTWTVLHATEAKVGQYRVTLQENPELQPFIYVNEVDGNVYQRIVAQGGPTLDDEMIREEDPELWEEITYVPEPERQLRPLEELTEDQLTRLSRYIYAGKPQVKLAAPRKAKPEELE